MLSVKSQQISLISLQDTLYWKQGHEMLVSIKDGIFLQERE